MSDTHEGARRPQARARALAMSLTFALTALGPTTGPARAAGTDTAAQLPGGASSLSETYGAWQVACRVLEAKGKAPVKRCEMSQQLTTQRGQRTLAVKIVPTRTGAQGVLILPFGVAVSRGVQLGVDGAPLGGSRPYSTCLQIGCLVPLSLDDKMLGVLEKGGKLTVAAAAADGKTVNLPVSLKGFRTAANRTRALLK